MATARYYYQTTAATGTIAKRLTSQCGQGAVHDDVGLHAGP
jgi:hypothetical protein